MAQFTLTVRAGERVELRTRQYTQEGGAGGLSFPRGEYAQNSWASVIEEPLEALAACAAASGWTGHPRTGVHRVQSEAGARHRSATERRLRTRAIATYTVFRNIQDGAVARRR